MAPNVSREKLILRTQALLILGEAYSGVRKDNEEPEAEYVRVDTKVRQQ